MEWPIIPGRMELVLRARIPSKTLAKKICGSIGTAQLWLKWMSVNITDEIMMAAVGPYIFSSGACIYPLKPVSSQTPATTDPITRVDQAIQRGKLSNIL